MPLPPSFLEEMRARLPLSGVVGQRVRLLRAGREFKGCCPFHNEKTPSFYVNDEKQFYHCFGCGAHGDVINFVMRHDRLSFPEAIESLAAQAGLSVPQNTPQERERYDLEKRLFLVLERVTAWFEEQLFLPSGREALNYLHGRGLSDDAIRRFRLGYAPNDAQALIRKMTSENFSLEELMTVGIAKKAEDRPDHFSFFRNRVMFPVGDRRGRTVAFGGRVMGDGEPKYLNSPDHPLFHKGHLLYGLSRARTAVTQGQPIVVVEGYMDVIAMVEEGFVGAVAPLGTALTEDQIAILWKLLPPLDARNPSFDYSPILCFDGDNAGQRAAARGVERILPLLTATQTARVAYLPEGEDPDSLIKRSGKSSLQAILDQAKPMVDVLWEMTLAGRRLQTPEDQATLRSALRQKVTKIRDESLRRLYGEEIKKRLDTTFQWRPQNQPRGKNFDGKKRPIPVQDIPLRPQATNPKRLCEKIMLAILVNYPPLLGEFGEDLARISFTNPDLEVLRQRLVDLLSSDSHEPLDAAALYRHLSGGEDANNVTAGLAETLSEATYMNAKYARPERSIDQARQGWKSIWNKQLKELLQADLETAKRRSKEEASDANNMRVEALRNQLLALNSESLDDDGDPSLSSI